MVRQLGRYRSTIYREIKRNTFDDRELPDYDGYYSTVAHDICSAGVIDRRRSQPAGGTHQRSGRGDMSRAETLRRADSGCDSSFKHRWYALATAES